MEKTDIARLRVAARKGTPLRAALDSLSNIDFKKSYTKLEILGIIKSMSDIDPLQVFEEMLRQNVLIKPNPKKKKYRFTEVLVHLAMEASNA